MSYYQVVRTSIKNHQDTTTEIVCTTEDYIQASSYLVSLLAESFAVATKLPEVKEILYDGMTFDKYLEVNSVDIEEHDITAEEFAQAEMQMRQSAEELDDDEDGDDDFDEDAIVGETTQYIMRFPSQLHIEYKEKNGSHYDEIYHIAEIFAQIGEPV